MAFFFFPFIEQFLPNLNSTVLGENYFDRTYQMLYLLVKGTIPVEIHTTAVIFVSFQLPAVTEDDFYSSHNLVRNLALFLKIPSDKIRVSRIIQEGSLRRKRSTGLTVELEIGDPPLQFLSNGTAGMKSRHLSWKNVIPDPHSQITLSEPGKPGLRKSCQPHILNAVRAWRPFSLLYSCNPKLFWNYKGTLASILLL